MDDVERLAVLAAALVCVSMAGRVAHELATYVARDRDRYEQELVRSQLVGNLISNAVAYGEQGMPITVTSTIADSSCSLAVHNAGPPIPPEKLTTLFEPMTRGESGGNAARSIGLGLFIVREIARAHAGTIEVTSSAEAGTTFEVTWPQSTA